MVTKLNFLQYTYRFRINHKTLYSQTFPGPHFGSWTILNQCPLIVNWTLKKKFQWSSNGNLFFPVVKMHLKMSYAKWRPCCLILIVKKFNWSPFGLVYVIYVLFDLFYSNFCKFYMYIILLALWCNELTPYIHLWWSWIVLLLTLNSRIDNYYFTTEYHIVVDSLILHIRNLSGRCHSDKIHPWVLGLG